MSVRTFFATVALYPFKHWWWPLAWFIGGAVLYDFGMKAVWDPNSFSAWCHRNLWPILGILELVFLPGIFFGPWILLYQFLACKRAE
jgi:hypothetical protein